MHNLSIFQDFVTRNPAWADSALPEVINGLPCFFQWILGVHGGFLEKPPSVFFVLFFLKGALNPKTSLRNSGTPGTP